LLQTPSKGDTEGEESVVAAEQESEDNQNESNAEQNESTEKAEENEEKDSNEDKKTTLFIKEPNITQNRVNRSKVKMTETERSIQTRNRMKKDLPNNLELKIVRPDLTLVELTPKRGRPKKYEMRSPLSSSKTATRRYPCPFAGCEYIAKYRSNLWDHKKLHTGEKPYACNLI
jgi:hypothetical protein